MRRDLSHHIYKKKDLEFNNKKENDHFDGMVDTLPSFVKMAVILQEDGGMILLEDNESAIKIFG